MSSLASEGLRVAVLFVCFPGAFQEGNEEERNVVLYETGESASNIGFVTHPITLDEDTVDKPHAPSDARDVLENVFGKPLQVTDPSASPCEAKQKHDVRHTLVIANDDGVLALGDSIARDTHVNAVNALREDDPKTPN